MAVILFRLNSVPDDEADEVRELLAEHGFDFYETSAGRWGFSVAAIWLRDEERLAEGRRLIEIYQQQRTEKIRAEHDELRAAGELETLRERIIRHPLQSLFALGLIGVILYFSIMPFIDIGT